MPLLNIDKARNLIFFWKLYNRYTVPGFDATQKSDLEDAFLAAPISTYTASNQDTFAGLLEAPPFSEALKNPTIKRLYDWADSKGVIFAMIMSTVNHPVLGSTHPVLTDNKQDKFDDLLQKTLHQAGIPHDTAVDTAFIKAVEDYQTELSKCPTPRSIAAEDAWRNPGIANYISQRRPGISKYMLTANDIKEILGEHLKTSEILSPGNYILSDVKKDSVPIKDRIEIIKAQCLKANINGRVTTHIPLSTGEMSAQGHWTLLSLTFECTNGQTVISYAKISDSMSGPDSKTQGFHPQRLDEIFMQCPADYFTTQCQFEYLYRGVQSSNLFCGDYTLQEALRNIGVRLGDIAADNSQDGYNGHKLRAATSKLAHASLIRQGLISQDETFKEFYQAIWLCITFIANILFNFIKNIFDAIANLFKTAAPTPSSHEKNKPTGTDPATDPVSPGHFDTSTDVTRSLGATSPPLPSPTTTTQILGRAHLEQPIRRLSTTASRSLSDRGSNLRRSQSCQRTQTHADAPSATKRSQSCPRT